jgi:hypothetical protein
MNDVHRLYRVVYIHENRGWRIRAANGAFASATYASQDEAVAYAKGLAEGHGWARIVVHREDGTVTRDFVFGSDRREHYVRGRELRVMRPDALERPSWA